MVLMNIQGGTMGKRRCKDAPAISWKYKRRNSCETTHGKQNIALDRNRGYRRHSLDFIVGSKEFDLPQKYQIDNMYNLTRNNVFFSDGESLRLSTADEFQDSKQFMTQNKDSWKHCFDDESNEESYEMLYDRRISMFQNEFQLPEEMKDSDYQDAVRFLYEFHNRTVCHYSCNAILERIDEISSQYSNSDVEDDFLSIPGNFTLNFKKLSLTKKQSVYDLSALIE